MITKRASHNYAEALRQPHVITGYFKAPHVRYVLDE
jgi:hypothetical protein